MGIFLHLKKEFTTKLKKPFIDKINVSIECINTHPANRTVAICCE